MQNRREWLGCVGLGAMGAATPAKGQESPARKTLDLSEFQPKSMLHAKETVVDRSKYPVIDVHTHISFAKKSEAGVPLSAERVYLATPESLLAVMDRRNIRAMVNLTGGFGSGLTETIAKYDRAHPGRFYTFCEPCYGDYKRADFPQYQAGRIEEAHRAGARGLKVVKTLGLYLRENITTGPLVKVDDPRFDPMWDACGQYNLPVAIHVSDPSAFFLATDRFNERFEELNAHPDWSFHGKDFPSNDEILAARNRMFARHPKTQFITLHVGNFAENLDNVSEALDRFPNMTVELGARIGELGRQPRASMKFFDKYQDRILFGTDAVPRRRRYAAAGLRRQALPDLLPLSRDRGRVLRLCARRHPSAGTLANLRRRSSG